MSKKSFHAGVGYTLLSASGIALVGLFGKLGALVFSLDALIFWRFLAAFFLCLLFLAFMGKLRSVFSVGHVGIHVMRALFVLGAQYSFYYYIQRGTLMNGLVLLSLGPLTIPFIEKILTGNPIGRSTWIGLVVSFAGVVCILQPDGGIFSFLSLVGVLAGLSQGCSQVVLGLTSKTEKAELSTLYMFLLCVILSAIPYAFFDARPALQQEQVWYGVGIIFLLGIASVLNQMTRAIAYQHDSPARLSTFLYFAILLGTIFDWFIFHHRPNLLSIVGAVLVVAGGLLKVYLRSIIVKNK